MSQKSLRHSKILKSLSKIINKSTYCKRESCNPFDFLPEEKELYLYGFKILIQWVVNLALIILLGFEAEMIAECLWLLISFMLIRKFSGGLHLKKYVLCLISSGVILWGGLFLIKHTWFVDMRFFRVLVLLASSLISIISPIIHPNKNINAHETKVYHLLTIVITNCFMIFTVVLLDVPRLISWGYSIGTGIILCCVLTVVGKIRYSKKESKL